MILEDSVEKLTAVSSHLQRQHVGAEIKSVDTFTDYLRELNREQYDFLILDLVVPRHAKSSDFVEIEEIVEVTRGDYRCPNFRTPGIALTGFDEKAEEHFRLLNQHDFAIITYSTSSQQWATAIDHKIASLPSRLRFDYVILCALEEEAAAFSQLGYPVGQHDVLYGMQCRTINAAGRTGMLITAPRMGLVTAAITASQAIQSFEPQLICMSGICGGIQGQANIYDVIVADTCHQHDAGKWTGGTLKPEIYSVAIDHQFAQKVRSVIGHPDFVPRVVRGITPTRTELPEDRPSLYPAIRLAPASSGSAVLADEGAVDLIRSQQRKCAIFEMESYAMYEAARLSPLQPKYFSAKTVVDDGINKSDSFHRIGCLLSARVVCELLEVFPFA